MVDSSDNPNIVSKTFTVSCPNVSFTHVVINNVIFFLLYLNIFKMLVKTLSLKMTLSFFSSNLEPFLGYCCNYCLFHDIRDDAPLLNVV